MKHILDSVHGTINVPDEYFSIIDTPEFQRLRRVEQTSIRSIFPSARHDRFIHSLGVFHIGNMIVDHLSSTVDDYTTEWGCADGCVKEIFRSYKIACLLHDVGHAPFSHTFEHYYGKKDELSEQLCGLIQQNDFGEDMKRYVDDASPHEYVSAYVVYSKFKKIIEELQGDPIFVVRMIVGCFYSDNVDKEPVYQLRNCFISLLHGEVVDADRLDYACRDIWASGYSTSNIDLSRLIDALQIRKCGKTKELVVCFYSNVVNEIESLVAVKNFQNRYVFNHHTVVYDQNLLQRAVAFSAVALCGEEIKKQNPDICDEELSVKAMKQLCSINSMVESTQIGTYTLYNPTDDDFITLMKQDKNNTYFKEWISRQYEYFPVWKSQEEFAHFFGSKKGKSGFVNGKSIRKKLLDLGYAEGDFIFHDVKSKPKIKLSSLYVLVHGETVRFTDIYEEKEAQVSDEMCYLYIRKTMAKNKGMCIEDLRKSIVNDLRKGENTYQFAKNLSVLSMCKCSLRAKLVKISKEIKKWCLKI